MNDKRVNQYLILPEQGQRKDTKLAVEYSEEQIAELLKQGYVIVHHDDFNKLIGNADGEYLIADDGSVYPKPAPTDWQLQSNKNSPKSVNGRRPTSQAVLSAVPAASLYAMTAI